MEQVPLPDLDPDPASGRAAKRDLAAALAATDVALNHYEVAPGERVSGLHAHGDQEELFVVLDGEATIETLEGDRLVPADEAVRFARGEYHSVTNDDTRPLSILAIGAPPDSEDVRIPLPCPACDHDFRRPVPTDSGAALACPGCGEETTVTCDACGGGDLYAALGHDGEPVSICRDCGATVR